MSIRNDIHLIGSVMIKNETCKRILSVTLGNSYREHPGNAREIPIL